MKKLFLGSLMLCSILASAQFSLQLRETRFGVIAGPDHSRVRNAHNPSSGRTSFFAGAFALTPLDYDDQFYLQTQVEYLEAGEKGNNGKATYAVNYLSVPIYLKAYFSEAENEFFGFIGPRFAFLLNQNVKNPNVEAYYPEKQGKAAGFDIAISGGAGFSYKRKWEISGRYDWGFSNTLPNLKATGSAGKKTPQHVVNVGISYIFD